jgi:hypothetical protein
MEMGEPFAIEVDFEASSPIHRPYLGLIISSAGGTPVLNANNRYQPSGQYAVGVRKGTIRCSLGLIPLMPDRYSVSLWLGSGALDSHSVDEVLRFDVVEKDVWGEGRLPPKGSSMWWPAAFAFSASAKRGSE